MSEKIYACLLRLYPSAFREKYHEEALQLYRDSLLDEAGIFRRCQLCCDLLVDALIGLPQAWRNSYTVTTAPAQIMNADGIPSFRILDQQPLRPASIFAASALSFAALAIFGLVMGLPTLVPPSSASKQSSSSIESVLKRLNSAAPPGNDDRMTSANASAAAGGSPGESRTGNASAIPTLSSAGLGETERDRVIRAVASILVAHYIDHQKAREASDSLLSRERRGEYDAIGDGPSLAKRLTQDIQGSTQDSHLVVQYRMTPIPSSPPVPSAAQQEAYRAAMMRQNCTIEQVQVLPGNIGYIKFDFIPQPDVCRATFRASMERLDHSDAIIIDLRDNTGGFPEMVADLAADLIEHPALWYNPRETPDSSMLSPVPGSKLARKPVYILTSSRTFSGAEQFTYNLKMLGRATVVGETTRGGHVGTIYWIDKHFWMAVPQLRKSSPYGKPDWVGAGIEPDVKVSAADALAVAERLAVERRNK